MFFTKLQNCWGFVDANATIELIARSRQKHKIMYNGHRSVKSIEFQATAAPNGLIGNLEGPYKGRNYNTGLLAETRLLL